MANRQHQFERYFQRRSTLNIGSDCDDSYVTEIADGDLEALRHKVSQFIAVTKKFSAYIVHKEGQPAKLMISLGETKAKPAYTKSMRSKPTKKLLVKNVPPASDKEHLQMFFEYKSGQGGGRVKHVTLNYDRTAIIEFEEAKYVDVVLQKAPIKMLGETVEVKAFVPYLDPGEAIDSINVNGLPATLSSEVASMSLKQGIASMSLEQGMPGKRRLKVGDRVRVKRSVKEPRYNWGRQTHQSVGTVRSFDVDLDLRLPTVFINFPSEANWRGDPDEMEIVD